MRTVLALVILSATAHGQTPYWTPFERYAIGSVKSDRYGSSYGFELDRKSAVVTRRFVYPVADPPLFAGDTIVEVKGQPVTSAAEANLRLDDLKLSVTPIKIERRYPNGETKVIDVKVRRSTVEDMYILIDRGEQARTEEIPLTSKDTDSFGMINFNATFIGLDQSTSEPVFRINPSGLNGAKIRKFASSFSEFVIRDVRKQAPDFSTIVLSEFPVNKLEPGSKVVVQPSFVRVMPPAVAKIDSKDVDVVVFAVCDRDSVSKSW